MFLPIGAGIESLINSPTVISPGDRVVVAQDVDIVRYIQESNGDGGWVDEMQNVSFEIIFCGVKSISY